jgi:adenosylmethionine-8-amino-7-oxononanoate aminotransferase
LKFNEYRLVFFYCLRLKISIKNGIEFQILRWGVIVNSIFHRMIDKKPPYIKHGEGIYLVDKNDRRYIDASGGPGVSSLGHRHPKIIEAVKRQLDLIEYVHYLSFTNDMAELLGKRLVEAAPDGFGHGRSLFVGSGSEATEAAIKLARQHFVEKGEPQRIKFIARHMSYHGNTLGALSISGLPWRRKIYTPMLSECLFVSPCYAYRFKLDKESDEEYAQRLAQELADEIESQGADNVAAFVLETVSGASLGCVPPVSGYFKRIREVCDHYGVLLITDEVMCGMGRTGRLFAVAAEGVAPDLVMFAKGLGAGVQPIGAVLARESVIKPIAEGSGLLAHGHTYMNHPVACAAALAVLETIEEDKLLKNVRQMGEILKYQLNSSLEGLDNVGDIRGRGLFWAIELVNDKQSKIPFPRSMMLAEKIRQRAQENGLLCYPGSGTADGINGDHILLAPPFIINEDQIGEIVEKLESTLSQCLK